MQSDTLATKDEELHKRSTELDPVKLPVTDGRGSLVRRLDYIDGLRALAALFVVLGHIYWNVWPLELHKQAPLKISSMFGWMMWIHFAVTVFIVLSGFCLMLPVLKNNMFLKGGALLFFKKRARRILPPYYFAMAFALLLIYTLVGNETGTHWDRSVHVGWDSILTRLLLVQNFSPSGDINHVFWSIAVEWDIYFLFPLLLLFWRRLGWWAPPLFGLAVGLLCARFSGMVVDKLLPNSHIIVQTPHYLAMFAFGALAAAIAFGPDAQWKRIRTAVPWNAVSGILWLSIGLYLWKVGFKSGNPYYVDHVIGVAACALLIHASVHSHSLATRVLSWRPLAWIGGFSYSLYLVHPPLIQVVQQYLLAPYKGQDGLVFGLLIVIGMPLIVGVSYLFYLVCERPFTTQAIDKKQKQEIPAAIKLRSPLD